MVVHVDVLGQVAAQAQGCRNCDRYRGATQVVFGEGSPHARLMLVGEQPDEAEDRQGRPFVGRAGLLLDRAVAEAGLDRADLYVTEVVKHLSWAPPGSTRVHQAPTVEEVAACRPWLEQEVAAVGPELVVALGDTAAGALLGEPTRAARTRGTFHDTEQFGRVMPTVDPSSVLRAGRDQRPVAFQALVDDLALAAARLAKG